MRDILLAPVPDVLRYTLHDIHTGFFALDYNNIRTSKLAVRSFHFKLVGNLEGVVFRVFKVNIADIKRLTSAIREIFLHAFSRAEKLIDFLIGGVESRSTVLVYHLYRFGDRTTGKKSSLAAKLIGLLAQKSLQFSCKQHGLARASLLLGLAAGNNRISQSFNYFQRPIL